MRPNLPQGTHKNTGKKAFEFVPKSGVFGRFLAFLHLKITTNFLGRDVERVCVADFPFFT